MKAQKNAIEIIQSFSSQYEGQWPTIVELFDITVSRFGSRPAFTSFDAKKISYSYEEVLARVERLSAKLLDEGIKKGDKVVLMGKNSSEWAMSYLAILFAGATVVPLDYQLSMQGLANLIAFASPALVLSDREKVAELRGLLSDEILVYANDAKDAGIYANLPEQGRRGERVSENELAAILFTSGTTGTPKGVMLTHQNLVSDIFLAQMNLNISEEDVFYALLPIHHSYTMLAVFLESISVGAELVFGKRMAVGQILKDMKQGQVTMFLGVPVLFNKLLKGLLGGVQEKSRVLYRLVRILMWINGYTHKLGFSVDCGLFKKLLSKIALDTNRICISGGGPLPAKTVKDFNALGIKFIEGYGLTETSPILALNPIEKNKPGAVGAILPEVNYRIVDADAKGYGELVVKGPMVCQGYYNNPEATAALFNTDGYLKTGDVGFVDKDGYLYLTGRAKNLIVTEGGKNVFPEEIEDMFQLEFDVEQILVHGILKDKELKSESIEALIYPSDEARAKCDGDKAKLEELILEVVRRVNKSLASYQKIEHVVIVDKALEMTTSKKIKRYLYKDEHGSGIGAISFKLNALLDNLRDKE